MTLGEKTGPGAQKLNEKPKIVLKPEVLISGVVCKTVDNFKT